MADPNCKRCGGTGTVYDHYGHGMNSMSCPVCNDPSRKRLFALERQYEGQQKEIEQLQEMIEPLHRLLEAMRGVWR